MCGIHIELTADNVRRSGGYVRHYKADISVQNEEIRGDGVIYLKMHKLEKYLRLRYSVYALN